MVTLVCTDPVFPSKNNFVKAIRKNHPAISTVILNINDKSTSMVLGERNITLYGRGYIEDELCGCRFRISPGSFYQVNPPQTQILYDTAIRYAHLTGHETVMDAYCGTGTIGIIASGHAGRVYGVELNKDAVRDAIWNARRNDVKNIRFVNKDAGEYMNELSQSGENELPDVVILDPPRTGTTQEFIDAAARMAPDRIVYVSCGPDTLARDLKLFRRKGYKALEAQPVDLFPFTEHVETVCCLYHQKKDFISVPYEPKDVEYLKK
jgi:23S rRNA (uracil1939-C5)-methyltransferase